MRDGIVSTVPPPRLPHNSVGANEAIVDPSTHNHSLGGSFNPAHGGHRAISLAARKRLPDEVWWLVSPGNPFETTQEHGSARRAPQICPKAARRVPIRVSAIETQFRTRYTVDIAVAGG